MEKSELELFLEEKRSWYKKIVKVFCPVLNEWVIFNAKGFRHLRYDGLGKTRNISQQVDRMKLLPLSITAINSAQKVSAYRNDKNIQYWALEKSISRKWLTVVILRKIGSGNVTFYSIWKKKVNKKALGREIL